MRRLLIGVTALVVLVTPAPVLTARASAQNPVRTTPGGITFNFQDADISYVVSMLAQAAGIRYVYSDMPQKPVTMRTTDPVSAEAVVALIKSLAESNGIVVTSENGFLRLQGVPTIPGQQPDPRQLYIVRLKHARAPVLANTLSALFGGALGTNVGRPNNATTLTGQIQNLQRAGAAQQQNVTIPNFTIRGGTDVTALIIPDELTNSLLIRATPTDWQVIQQAVGTLDLRPLQVVIEVVIAEVQHSKDLNLGINATGNKDNTGIGDVAGGLSSDTTSGFSLRILRQGTINVSATLSAFAAKGNVRILARPVIQAQNNQEASINVGSEVPFVQASQALSQTGALNQIIQYRDVGTNLTITPTINPDGYVNMAVSQTVSNKSNEVQFNAPVINTREAVTQILARDGQTVAIGGLIDHTVNKRRGGIPFLKDIPLIGWLFGSTTESDSNSELFLFLTPHVVMTDEDADRMKSEIEKNSSLLEPLLPISPLITPRGAVVKPDTGVKVIKPIKPDTIKADSIR
jgi:general secretion pathway protein D